jgi:hypothetical protein
MIIATAQPGPESVLFARECWGTDIAFVVATKFDIVWAVQSAFADALSHRAVCELAERDPELSAREVFTPAQVVFVYALLTLLLVGLAITPVATLVVVNVAMSLFYLGSFLFRGILVSVGAARSANKDQAIAVQARIRSDDGLPVFTVLVPMFREPEMLPILARSLRQLDYPLGKLDIKLVLEVGDHETIDVASKCAPPPSEGGS